MNVIFDIGKVLIDFDFEGFARRILGDEEVSQNVIDAMWNSGDWNELDRGVLSDEEVLGRFIAHAPRYEREIRLVFSKIAQCPRKRESTIPIIQTLKGLGHGVYFLSNYFYFLLHSAPEALDFTEYMDGGIFSCTVKITKPDKRIYQLLCERYGLLPSECVFIDDTLKNVAAARSLGMRGIHYTGQDKDTLLKQILN